MPINLLQPPFSVFLLYRICLPRGSNGVLWPAVMLERWTSGDLFLFCSRMVTASSSHTLIKLQWPFPPSKLSAGPVWSEKIWPRKYKYKSEIAHLKRTKPKDLSFALLHYCQIFTLLPYLEDIFWKALKRVNTATYWLYLVTAGKSNLRKIWLQLLNQIRHNVFFYFMWLQLYVNYKILHVLKIFNAWAWLLSGKITWVYSRLLCLLQLRHFNCANLWAARCDMHSQKTPEEPL